jgi:hypothetical protein
MIKIDEQLLVELGIHTGSELDNRSIENISSMLETNVSLRMLNELGEEKVDELSKLIDEADEEAANKWLEANYPGYQEIIKEEFQLIKKDIDAQNTDADRVLNQILSERQGVEIEPENEEKASE